jgi:RNA polymerase sigma-70 factor (ECF subfamily)
MQGSTAIDGDEQLLIAALRRGEDSAFVTLVDRYHATLVRLARLYVRDDGVANEVVQETWLAMLNGIQRFEGRSSLKTWISAILTNIAKTQARRERRMLPFSTLAAVEASEDDPAVPADRFATGGPYPNHWDTAPQPWVMSPDDQVLSAEMHGIITSVLGTLPTAQQEVTRLRDIEGWTAAEVCAALSISAANQRVLLHRGRSKLRLAIEQYFTAKAGVTA